MSWGCDARFGSEPRESLAVDQPPPACSGVVEDCKKRRCEGKMTKYKQDCGTSNISPYGYPHGDWDPGYFNPDLPGGGVAAG